MIKIYDNALPDVICKGLIDVFEKNTEHHEFIDYNSCPCFTQLNLNNFYPNTVPPLIPYLAELYKKYKKDIKSKYIPPLKDIEKFRIKRYNTSGDERFDEDGNTLFPLHNLNIKPISGRVLVFPPTWEYPHSGLPPKTDSKYIMSTYIHYGEN